MRVGVALRDFVALLLPRSVAALRWGFLGHRTFLAASRFRNHRGREKREHPAWNFYMKGTAASTRKGPLSRALSKLE
jgi:hypothetical protein